MHKKKLGIHFLGTKMTKIYEELALANQWTNNKLRNHLKNNNINIYELQTPYGSVAEVVLHLIDWIHNWLNRVEISNYTLSFRTVDDYSDPQKIFLDWEKADIRYLQFIQSIQDFEKIIYYTDSEGHAQNLKLSAILLQLSHHFVNHRAHIALKLRDELNLPAPPLEIIFWFLKQSKKDNHS